MPDPRIVVTTEGQVATVTFNRPEAHNAFDLAMWGALGETMDALSADDDLRCVVLRGAGKSFCAGADLVGFQTERATREQEDRYAPVFHHGMQSIRRCRHPVVAQIHGNALGGGAGIATMCDFRVGGEHIRLGITARQVGLWYPYSEIDAIVQIAGVGVAAEMLIEGRIFTGREAYEKGLLSRCVPDTEVAAATARLVTRIAEGAPLAARFHKAAIRRLRGALPVTAEEDRAGSGFVETEDFRNAVAAFAAKRTPRFEGR